MSLKPEQVASISAIYKDVFIWLPNGLKVCVT